MLQFVFKPFDFGEDVIDRGLRGVNGVDFGLAAINDNGPHLQIALDFELIRRVAVRMIHGVDDPVAAREDGLELSPHALADDLGTRHIAASALRGIIIKEQSAHVETDRDGYRTRGRVDDAFKVGPDDVIEVQCEFFEPAQLVADRRLDSIGDLFLDLFNGSFLRRLVHTSEDSEFVDDLSAKIVPESLKPGNDGLLRKIVFPPECHDEQQRAEPGFCSGCVYPNRRWNSDDVPSTHVTFHHDPRQCACRRGDADIEGLVDRNQGRPKIRFGMSSSIALAPAVQAFESYNHIYRHMIYPLLMYYRSQSSLLFKIISPLLSLADKTGMSLNVFSPRLIFIVDCRQQLDGHVRMTAVKGNSDACYRVDSVRL